MLSADEIARSAGAAWTLFRGDARGLRQFDLSVDGFWRSFAVILLLIPAIGILMASERLRILEATAVSDEAFPAAAFFTSRLTGHVLGWFDYPLVLALLARPLGITRSFVPLVVSLNWISLLAAVPVTLPSLLHVLGLIGAEAAGVLDLVALGVVVRYQYVVTRIATGAPPGFSFGLVALDYVLGIALSLTISRFAGI